MKTKIIIELTSPTHKPFNKIPDFAKDYGYDNLDEFNEDNKEFCEDFHDKLIKFLIDYLKDDFEENYIDYDDELWQEHWDNFDHAGVKLNIKKIRGKK